MDDSEATSLEQVRAFLAGSGEVRFAGQCRAEIYAWTERTLLRHQYAGLSRREKGLLRRYVARMTGLSRAQVTRLIASYAETGHVKGAPQQRRKFAARYTKADVELLAYVDKSHGNLSGPATKRILEREFGEYSQAAYQRLAGISVAQIYRFRNSESYRKRNTSYQPTRPTPIPIGERRKPRPQGRPGYLRIDTVHQGDRDGVKGVYHINAFDELTQWEIVATAPQISEHWLIPVLEQLLEQFPFTVRRIHQLHGHQTTGQAAHRTDQITRSSYGRQRAGGVEKRTDHSQTHGFWPHRRAGRRNCRPVSSPVSESLHQLSSALRGGRDSRRAQWQAAARLPSVGHAVRDLQPDAGMRNLPAAGNNHGGTGTIPQEQSDTESAIEMQ